MTKPNIIRTITFAAALFALGTPLVAAAQSDATIHPFSSRASIAAVAEYPPLPLDKDAASSVYWYELLPATGNKLPVPVVITMVYPEQETRWKEIFIYNQELGRWQRLPGSINPGERRLIAPTTWASGFIAVFADHLDQSEYLKEKLEAPSILVVDASSGEILIERGSGITRPIASLTKLMTAAEFLAHNPGFDERIAMIASDDTIPAKIYAKTGDVFTTRDLFYATLLKSANNAAKALARSTGLSQDAFVAAMNQKADELGMADTTFVEPTGLSAGNISTAQDLYKLSRSAFSDMLFLKATTPKSLTIASINNGKRHILENTNKAIDVPYVVIGSKTGYTVEAGRCVIMKARNNEGREVIAITLGGESPGSQWDDMRMLLDAALGE